MKSTFISFIAILVFASCSVPAHLHDTGVYTIKKRTGSVTEFYEVSGQYEIRSDTLKVNDKILINVIKARAPKGKNNKAMIAHN